MEKKIDGKELILMLYKLDEIEKNVGLSDSQRDKYLMILSELRLRMLEKYNVCDMKDDIDYESEISKMDYSSGDPGIIITGFVKKAYQLALMDGVYEVRVNTFDEETSNEVIVKFDCDNPYYVTELITGREIPVNYVCDNVVSNSYSGYIKSLLFLDDGGLVGFNGNLPSPINVTMNLSFDNVSLNGRRIESIDDVNLVNYFNNVYSDVDGNINNLYKKGLVLKYNYLINRENIKRNNNILKRII